MAQKLAFILTLYFLEILKHTQNTDNLNQQELGMNSRVSFVELHLRQQT